MYRRIKQSHKVTRYPTNINININNIGELALQLRLSKIPKYVLMHCSLLLQLQNILESFHHESETHYELLILKY